MIKNDPMSDSAIQEIYSAYAVMSLINFRIFCLDVIDSMKGNREKLTSFKREISSLNSKDRIVSKVSNFIMAGSGLKVI